MLNNVELFNECLENKVPNIDPVAHDALNKVIIPEEKNAHCDLLSKNAALVRLLTQYSNYNNSGDTTHDEEIINNIDAILRSKGMNLSPFSQYLMVHDLTYGIYLKDLSLEEKKFVIDSYLRDRHQMYINHNYSGAIFQVLNDNYSHKRKAVIGVEKIRRACEANNIPRFDGDLSKNSYFLLPDNGDKDIFKEALELFHIRFEFAAAHQDKMPDAFIKYGDKFIIVEHKKMKGCGGGQDKQITEIIEFIKYEERDVYYVSYLDGILFNQLFDPRPTQKLFRAKEDIVSYLEDNPCNYFVNEYGFNKLLSNIVEN